MIMYTIIFLEFKNARNMVLLFSFYEITFI